MIEQSKPKLLVITPVFNEAANLDRFVDETTRVLLAAKDIETRFLLRPSHSFSVWRKD